MGWTDSRYCFSKLDRLPEMGHGHFLLIPLNSSSITISSCLLPNYFFYYHGYVESCTSPFRLAAANEPTQTYVYVWSTGSRVGKIMFPDLLAICLLPHTVVNVLMLIIIASPTAKYFLLTKEMLVLQVTRRILMALVSIHRGFRAVGWKFTGNIPSEWKVASKMRIQNKFYFSIIRELWQLAKDRVTNIKWH